MRNVMMRIALLAFVVFGLIRCASQQQSQQEIAKLFNDDWFFHLGDVEGGYDTLLDVSGWRKLSLPHDWSIELPFDEHAAAGVGGGALPGGIGWYRKTFTLDDSDKDKVISIRFDGVYRNSEVWVNGNKVGFRPNGYASFQYDITSHVHYNKPNIIAVRVDNDKQPNSRWYSGSGIYRNVWLFSQSSLRIAPWGTFVQTPSITEEEATVSISVEVINDFDSQYSADIVTIIKDASGKEVAKLSQKETFEPKERKTIQGEVVVKNPKRWSLENPSLYTAVTNIHVEDVVVDVLNTTFGVRSFSFDVNNGFFLNGESVKIKGVCLHHDLGALGAAFNKRAMQRQLEIMRGMGVNAIRTAHNPPAPEVLQLCDEMGFLVMDEVFDMWKKRKSEYDYSHDWDEWYVRDLEDFIKRDRNHASVFIWSVGNEIGEQWDDSGVAITKELVSIVRSLDTTRLITTGNNEIRPSNSLIRANVLDVLGYNYNHQEFDKFQQQYPGKLFIATETTSALATRGHYDMPSDTIKRWPISWDKIFTDGNKDNTVSSYDHVSTPWGSTHEETLQVMMKHAYLSGMFIWTGFDYLGEPTPYVWPSRSSYFGVVDLAGFPKDAYYLYKSVWTNENVLHLFPHWNWNEGEDIDLWAYYNNADEVELYVNNVSAGVRKKEGDAMHVMWRVPFQSGEIKAVSRRNGVEVMTTSIKTASSPAKLKVDVDRTKLEFGKQDLSFITVSITDAEGNLVPNAENVVEFKVEGTGKLKATDNGDPVDHTLFQSSSRKAFHGKCLGIVRADQKGEVVVTISSQGLPTETIILNVD